MRIFSVQQVTVIKNSETPLELTVTAIGVASTSGWTNPRLDGTGDPAPADAVIELSFEADRPGGIALQVLTPITATAVIRPPNGVDAVIVSARTNSVTVHASDFITIPVPQPVPFPRPPFTTFAVGEEMFPTTLMFGEETQPTTFALGEEDPFPFTIAIRRGEHGPWTDPRVDDPVGISTGIGGGIGPSPWPGPPSPWDPFRRGGNPFGGF